MGPETLTDSFWAIENWCETSNVEHGGSCKQGSLKIMTRYQNVM